MWLVELGAIRDASLVPTTVAHVLGVQETGSPPLVESLGAYLKAHEVLLLLDNCEHLLDACARLADTILRDAASTTIIATSREPLNIAGEQIYPLQPLSLPDASSDFGAMQGSEAVQMFVERVRQQLPDFELTASRAPAVGALCIHLDGIPLALELAAARARSLSVEQIGERLRDRFKLLVGGGRTAVLRQQTLRATLDWSFDLLTEAERTLLRRLAIFPGSFSLEAASAVAFDAADDACAIVDRLAQLVARSMLIADTGAKATRYRMLETTRAYCQEKLAEAEETGAIQRRHAHYFRDLFHGAPEEWARIPDKEWRAIYGPELDNVRVALDWALGAGGDTSLGIRLCAGAAALWMELTLGNEGRKRLEAALELVNARTPALDQARLWFFLGALVTKERQRSVESYRRAVELYRRAGDPLAAALSLLRMGSELVYMGRLGEATPAINEARYFLESAGPSKALAEYLLNSGTTHLFAGRLADARIDFERAGLVCRQTGAERLGLGVLSSLAYLSWMQGDLNGALANYGEAVAHARQASPARRRALGMYLSSLVGVHTERGELDQALAAAREGLPLSRESGVWDTLDHLALRSALVGKPASAARIAGYADSLYAANAALRQPNETRARDRLQGLLSGKLSSAELQRLLDEGAKLSEDEACRLALEG